MKLYTKLYTLRAFLCIYADIRRYFVHFFKGMGRYCAWLEHDSAHEAGGRK